MDGFACPTATTSLTPRDSESREECRSILDRLQTCVRDPSLRSISNSRLFRIDRLLGLFSGPGNRSHNVVSAEPKTMAGKGSRKPLPSLFIVASPSDAAQLGPR